MGRALTYLRRLHYRGPLADPSEVLAAIVADRRMLEVAATGPRARDAWRRLRFVVDQARAWSEAEHGGLRAYLAWAPAGQDASRVAEAVLPETDVDAVRIMTDPRRQGPGVPDGRAVRHDARSRARPAACGCSGRPPAGTRCG